VANPPRPFWESHLVRFRLLPSWRSALHISLWAPSTTLTHPLAWGGGGEPGGGGGGFGGGDGAGRLARAARQPPRQPRQPRRQPRPPGAWDSPPPRAWAAREPGGAGRKRRQSGGGATHTAATSCVGEARWRRLCAVAERETNETATTFPDPCVFEKSEGWCQSASPWLHADLALRPACPCVVDDGIDRRRRRR
jgi:hypothetical protein